MYHLHSWSTPNGHKVHTLLEELGVPWCLRPVNIREGEQFLPDFAAISPNNKIPVLDEQLEGGRRLVVMEYPALQRWFEAIQKRPAVERALALFPANASPLDYSTRAREILFGLGDPGSP